MPDRVIITENKPDGSRIEVVETERTFEFHIDGVHGLQVIGNTVKVNLFSQGWAPEDGERREIVCRPAMTLETFFALAKWISEQAADVQKQVNAKIAASKANRS